jgi:hypothetical protein
MGKSIELSTKHPQFKKIAVDNKKIQGKRHPRDLFHDYERS